MISEVFVKYFFCSVLASLIIGTWIAIRNRLRDRYCGKIRFFFWIALACFLVFPVGLIPEDHVIRNSTETIYQSSDHGVTGETLSENVEIRELPGEKQAPVIGEVFKRVISVNACASWLEGLAVIWLLGILASFAYEVVRLAFFRRKIRRWGKAAHSEVITQAQRAVCVEMNVAREIPVIVLKDLKTPCLAGVFRPFVLLPKADYTLEEARLVLKHEYTHFQKKHLWLKAFLFLARSLHWFNPLVHLAGRYAEADMENYCDESVLREENLQCRKAYMETIYQAIKDQNTPSFTATLAESFLIEERLAHIKSFDKKRKGSWMLPVMVMIVLLGNVLIGCGIQEAEKSQEDGAVAFLRDFVNDFNGTIAGQAQIDLDRYMKNDNLKRFSEQMLAYTKKQEAENGNAINYGAYNQFLNATCTKQEKDIYYVTLQFECEGSGMKGQFLVRQSDNGYDILDYYFGTPDGFDTMTTGHLAERTLDDPERWNKEEWVKTVFEKVPR